MWNIIALILNFVGTLFLVFYISVDENEWVEGDKDQKKGEKWFAILVKHPNLLKLGIIMISFGFFILLILNIVAYI